MAHPVCNAESRSCASRVVWLYAWLAPCIASFNARYSTNYNAVIAVSHVLGPNTFQYFSNIACSLCNLQNVLRDLAGVGLGYLHMHFANEVSILTTIGHVQVL